MLIPNFRREQILTGNSILNSLIRSGQRQLIRTLISRGLHNSQYANASSIFRRYFPILFVPHQEAWVVQRFGKFHRTLQPGLNFMVPLVDCVAYVQSLKELAIDIPDQPAITSDNVVLQINGVLYLKIVDPYLASYGVENAEYAITQLAQTTMRSEIGKISLDNVFQERETLNLSIVDSINKSAEPWGIDCLRYEIRDISLPEKISIAMQLQVEAERRKRASILESEGFRDAEINKAQGLKQSRILDSEAKRAERVNLAEAEATAIQMVSVAQAEAVKRLAASLQTKSGADAVQWSVAEQYIRAFGNLAKQGNTILLPTQAGDAASMVAQAMAIFKAQNGVVGHGTGGNPPNAGGDCKDELSEFTVASPHKMVNQSAFLDSTAKKSRKDE